MTEESRIRAFLDSLPPESLEREYSREWIALLTSIEIPRTEENGVACVMVMTESRITLITGEVLGDEESVMGTIEDAATVVAVLFADINSKPAWWKSCYPSYEGKTPVAEAASRIAKLIAALPKVQDFGSRH